MSLGFKPRCFPSQFPVSRAEQTRRKAGAHLCSSLRLWTPGTPGLHTCGSWDIEDRGVERTALQFKRCTSLRAIISTVGLIPCRALYVNGKIIDTRSNNDAPLLTVSTLHRYCGKSGAHTLCHRHISMKGLRESFLAACLEGCVGSLFCLR